MSIWGTQGIWEFRHYDTKELFKIRDANAILQRFSLGMPEEAERELNAELTRRSHDKSH